jgi:murein DD-endopeptidase MepM/ murein hydrolase activator NlpD
MILISCSFTFKSHPIYQTPSSDYHIVKEGETIYMISQKYSLPVEKLMLFNNMKQERVFVGQKIYLYPREKKKSDFVTTRSIPKAGFHIVKAKETIYRISKMYDVDILDLMDYNHLQDFELKKGMKLWLIPTEKSKQTEQEIIETAEMLKTQESQKEEKKKIKSSKDDLFLPVKGIVTSEFGKRDGRPHKGIDIAADNGDPIYAVLDGKVVYAGTQRGYGNVVIIEHDDLIMTVYAHNESNLVRLGEKVKKGQPIATVGSTGNSTAPHLHFEYRVKGKAINPREVLPNL